jgi:hypothetical protein
VERIVRFRVARTEELSVIDLSRFTAEVGACIDAPPLVVWELLADLSLTPRLNRETRSTRWVPPARSWVVGAVFQATNRIGSFEWSVDCHVTVADRGRELGWTVLGPNDPSSTWWYRLEAGGTSGPTEVRHGFRHGPNTSGVRMSIEREPERADEIIAGRIAMLTANMRHTLEQVRLLAEA